MATVAHYEAGSAKDRIVRGIVQDDSVCRRGQLVWSDNSARRCDRVDGQVRKGVKSPLYLCNVALLKPRAETDQHDGRRIILSPWQGRVHRELLIFEYRADVNDIAPAGFGLSIEVLMARRDDAIARLPELVERGQGRKSCCLTHGTEGREDSSPHVQLAEDEAMHEDDVGQAEGIRVHQGRRKHSVYQQRIWSFIGNDPAQLLFHRR